MKRAVLYIRAKEHQEHYLERMELQKIELLEYCKQNSIEVLKIFSDTSNEPSFYRTGFLEFLLYTKSKHKEIDLLLFTTWDRFSRRSTESYEMLQNLMKLNIEVQAINQPVIWDENQQDIMLCFYLGIQIEENTRLKKIRAGIEYKRNLTKKESE